MTDLITQLAPRITVFSLGCWIFHNQNTPLILRARGKTISVKRTFYTLQETEIPLGAYLVPVCRNTRCLNPEHHAASTNHTELQAKSALFDRDRAQLHWDQYGKQAYDHWQATKHDHPVRPLYPHIYSKRQARRRAP